MGTWTLLVKFIVFFIIPTLWYCDFSVLTYSLINSINECLPGTPSELLHVELFEWYEDHGRFFESNDFSQAISLLLLIVNTSKKSSVFFLFAGSLMIS